MSDDFIIDIHAHSTLRAYNAIPPNGSPNIWEQTLNAVAETKLARWARMSTREIAKYSQAHYYAMAEGKVRVLFDSLYPIETGFLKLRKVPARIAGKGGLKEIMSAVIGFENQKIENIFNRKDYFTDLKNQYEFLLKGQGPSPDGRFSYKLVHDFQELISLREHEPETLGVVVTVEGAHCFASGSAFKRKLSPGELKEMVSDNVRQIKSWEYPPFFITLAHHFWNQLGGHIRSMKMPVHAFFNQSTGLNTGMTELGWHTIRELLTRRNGRRVLIDSKHMSMKARKEFYDFIQGHNYLHPEDTIPIICSHTGVNGFKTMKGSIEKKDKKRKIKNSWFHSWAINLSDEEIRIIHDSGGLVGVMLDKGLLGGLSTVESITSLETPEERKAGFLKLIWSNIFQMVKAVGKPSGWDIISLGSDFDGLIVYIEGYETAEKLKNVYQDLIDYLEDTKYMHEYWYGYSPAELVEKVMQKNAFNFLKLHF
ncbi:MAG: membrane dipeptidase [Bacteroidia bacterium]|nr:membrane dipeptidase [Bacteroidia bacterium]